jgi:hypothetical protein
VLLACAIALLAVSSTPYFGSAREPESNSPERNPQQAESDQPEGREEWRERLMIANQELAIALKRSAAALKAYQSMRHRRRPRGEGKQAIMDEIELSGEELARAQQDLQSLEKAARRAGAPPSWLKFDPAEINAATQVPASLEP